MAHLGVERFMLIGHPKDSSDSPGVFACALLNVIVETKDPLPNSVSELQDLLQRWPILVLFRHNGVVLDRLRIRSARPAVVSPTATPHT